MDGRTKTDRQNRGGSQVSEGAGKGARGRVGGGETDMTGNS